MNSGWGRRGDLRIILALLLVPAGIWLFVIGADIVWAHALLVHSTPAANAELDEPPDTIEMWFSEPLEAKFSDARLLNSAGDEIETGDISLDPSDPAHMVLPLGTLEPDIYTVAWQTLSQVDGHEWYGSFPFTVLRPDGSRPAGTAMGVVDADGSELPGPDEVGARWLALLGAMLLFGSPLFQLAVVPRRSNNHFGRAAGRLMGIALVVAGVGIVLGGWLQILFQTFRLGDLNAMPDLLFETRTGVLVLARQTLAVAAVFVATYLLPSLRRRLALVLVGGYGGLSLLLLTSAGLRSNALIATATLLVTLTGIGLAIWLRHRTTSDVQQRGSWYITLGLSAGVLLGFSTGSHAAAVPGNGWAILGDFLHLVAAAAWIGGLVLLPALVWQTRSDAVSYERDDLLVLVRRFSYLAGTAVFVLAVTGIFSSLVELPSLSSLVTTTYGQVLLAKLVLIGLAMGIAFFNNRLVHRSTDRLRTRAGLRRFNRQVAVEAMVGVGIILVVAMLVQTPAPRSLADTTEAATHDHAFNTIAAADDLNIRVQVMPNIVGYNEFWVHLYHEDGSPIGEVQLVRLFFEYQEEQIGRAMADLTLQSDNIFTTEGIYLNQSGAWTISVYIRRRGMEDVLTDVHIEVPSPAGQAPATGSENRWQNPIPTIPATLLVVGLFVTLGVTAFIWHRRP